MWDISLIKGLVDVVPLVLEHFDGVEWVWLVGVQGLEVFGHLGFGAGEEVDGLEDVGRKECFCFQQIEAFGECGDVNERTLIRVVGVLGGGSVDEQGALAGLEGEACVGDSFVEGGSHFDSLSTAYISGR